LVEIVVNNRTKGFEFLVSIDSENLLRVWDCKESKTKNTFQIPCIGRVTAATVDESSRFLAIGTSFGEAKVINLASGGILYDLKTPSKAEISFLKFNISTTTSENWLFGACWGGRILLWNRPSPDNNFIVNCADKRKHNYDVVSLDSNDLSIASGDSSGVVKIWNVQSGEYKFGVDIYRYC
jgi:WD40 repeat protein